MTGPDLPSPPVSPATRSAIQIPGVLLVVVNALGLIGGMLYVPLVMLMRAQTAREAKSDAASAALLQVLDNGWAEWMLGLSLLLSVVGLIGGVQMLRRRGHLLAAVGAVVTMINLGGFCCLVNLAVGIWALVVLMREDVQQAFNRP